MIYILHVRTSGSESYSVTCIICDVALHLKIMCSTHTTPTIHRSMEQSPGGETFQPYVTERCRKLKKLPENVTFQSLLIHPQGSTARCHLWPSPSYAVLLSDQIVAPSPSGPPSRARTGIEVVVAHQLVACTRSVEPPLRAPAPQRGHLFLLRCDCVATAFLCDLMRARA